MAGSFPTVDGIFGHVLSHNNLFACFLLLFVFCFVFFFFFVLLVCTAGFMCQLTQAQVITENGTSVD